MKRLFFILFLTFVIQSCGAQQAALKKNANGSVTLFPSSSAENKIVISKSGNMGIGQPNPQDKLEVNGQIHAKAVEVDLDRWPDYVFNKDYELIDLKSLRAYIEDKGHLPNIPSEQEVIIQGLNLGEINSKLLEKIEELTLYLIEKDQQVDGLTKQLGAVINRLDQLEKIKN